MTGSAIETRGDPAYAVPLVAAFEAAAADIDPFAGLTHGLHPFTARMHPAIARVLLNELMVGRNSRVLDPFCGSGTVLVEAMVAGWHSLGSDLDPLALRLARVKTDRRDARSRDRFVHELERVAAGSNRRVRERIEIRIDLPTPERQWYEAHVLRELSGLMAEIRTVTDGHDRAALEMIFSAIVPAFYDQPDPLEPRAAKRIGKGLATEFFVRKGLELVERWQAFSEALPDRSHPSRLVLSDARVLPHTLAGEFRCDLILSAPPRGGAIDSLHDHSRRHAWLGIHPKVLREREIGARRHMSAGGERRGARWDAEMLDVLVALRELMRPDATMVLLVADAEVGRERVPADHQLDQLAVRAELEVVAVASKQREHLVALRPA